MAQTRHLRPAMLVIALAIPTVVQGQAIYGTVVDDTARGPVDGAEVDLLHEGAAVAGTVTDSLGRFTIAAPRAGTYGLVVRHAVFMTYQVDSVTLGTGESVTLQIRLGRQAVPLEPLVVTARRSRRGLAGFDERRRAGFGHFIVREDITTRAAGQLTDVLRNVPGLSFRRLRRGGVLTQMRGGASGRCAPAMWVDGIQMQESEQSTLDQIFAPDMIEAVEVYSSHATAPAQYVSGTCGVILFWTRQGSGAEGTPWQWKKVLAGAGAAVLVIILLAR